MCCFSQLSLLTEQLAHLIRIDPFYIFPREVSLTVLAYLDATSLCRAAQVSKLWRGLADDDTLWRGICEQHIGTKCLKCGWSLPVLDKKRVKTPSQSSSRVQSSSPRPPSPVSMTSSITRLGKKRAQDNGAACVNPIDRPIKRQRSNPNSPGPVAASLYPEPRQQSITRPWKDVYSERLTIERNWRRGRCSVRTLSGHTDGVMCLQFAETLAPHGLPCPILITGSYDRTVRVWNLETGTELRCLHGHTRAIRALQFDAAKLVTGSMDHTIRVWNWREGRCVRTLVGHEGGVVCLNFDSNVLASGSVDTRIKVWNLRTGEAFTLRGHTDWVNSVQLWDSNEGMRGKAGDAVDAVFEPASGGSGTTEPQIDPGKMLFSASDDGTIRLWDLTTRSCVRHFTGHVAQVQSMKLQSLDGSECDSVDDDGGTQSGNRGRDDETQHVLGTGPRHPSHPDPPSTRFQSRFSHDGPSSSSLNNPGCRSNIPNYNDQPKPRQRYPVLITGSLDNTIKLWDIHTGKTLRTFFGHIEGVWAVASDKLRLVSGSHDRTIKVRYSY